MKTLSVAGALALLCLLAGCDQVAKELKKQAEVGGCGDESTVALVKQAVGNMAMRETEGANERDAVSAALKGPVTLSLESIRTVAKDAAVNRYQCAGSLRITAAPAALQVLAGGGNAAILQASGATVEAGAVVGAISYTSQPTDDMKQVFVEVQPGPPVLGRVLWPGGVTALVAYSASQPVGDLCAGLDTSITSQLLECLGRKGSAAETRMKAAQAARLKGLSADAALAAEKEQIDWAASTQDHCSKAGDEFKGGTAQNVMIADCFVQATEKRAAGLLKGP